MTQEDYEARKARCLTGKGTGDDFRLVKHYERQGYICRGNSTETSSDSTPTSESASEPSDPPIVQTTVRHSPKPATASSTVRSTVGRGQTNASSGKGKPSRT